jgi:hypothetical protein
LLRISIAFLQAALPLALETTMFLGAAGAGEAAAAAKLADPAISPRRVMVLIACHRITTSGYDRGAAWWPSEPA